MTIRLSIINLAGIARTLVAVGTSNDADMFFTTAAAAPRRTCVTTPFPDGTEAAVFGAAGAAAAFCSMGAALRIGGDFAGAAVFGSPAAAGFAASLVDAPVSTAGSGA